MICKSCGRTIENANANFCDYCGDSLREQGFQNIQALNVHHDETEVKEGEKPVTFGNWLGSMLLFFIPFIGAAIYITMLIYWSFSEKIAKSKRDWARAALVIVFLFIFLGAIYLDFVIQQLGARGIDLNSYIRQFYGNY
ncbi:zinc-ribbon domain-containing protein [Anaerocolumna xylanovorans]|uniref:Zinc-ribbon domain-containing protein n=1 Tax=Anaerocolumna xylanovorans DSM 12503 TaxID=1121345 RepID=A0A1M7Y624_9FIRM|nr:zinc-ribbon domain-containing protein [Anaerocolumna xylanovorans]SHO47837.1 zinc-ribbon domain-containing protein [Anaerocolumna xylanovorans DSM 12503]